MSFDPSDTGRLGPGDFDETTDDTDDTTEETETRTGTQGPGETAEELDQEQTETTEETSTEPVDEQQSQLTDSPLANRLQGGFENAAERIQDFVDRQQEEETDTTEPDESGGGGSNVRPPSGGPPGGSETIQDGQPRDSGSDRVDESTDDEPTQPVDQQAPDDTVRQPENEGPPSGSETIQSGQPRDSGSDRVDEADEPTQPVDEQTTDSGIPQGPSGVSEDFDPQETTLRRDDQGVIDTDPSTITASEFAFGTGQFDRSQGISPVQKRELAEDVLARAPGYNVSDVVFSREDGQVTASISRDAKEERLTDQVLEQVDGPINPRNLQFEETDQGLTVDYTPIYDVGVEEGTGRRVNDQGLIVDEPAPGVSASAEMRERKAAREAYTEAFQEREETITEGVDTIEQRLEQQFPGTETLTTQAQGPPQVTGDSGLELDLSRDDVTVEDGQLRLTEDAAERVQEQQFEGAIDQIDRQLPTDVDRGDVIQQNGQLTLSEQGRAELEQFQEEQATEELLEQLREETGANLDRGDIRVEGEQTEEGTQFTAELTDEGQQELAGEQVPGSDLPVIGRGLEETGERAAQVEQAFLDVGDYIGDQVPDVDVPEIDLPDISTGQISTAAAAGVATPEPITTGTGALVLGSIAGTGVVIEGARRSGIGQGPPQAEAGTEVEGRTTRVELPDDPTSRGRSELTIPSVDEFFQQEQEPATGEALPSEELPVTEPQINQQEIGVPDQTSQADPRTLVTGELVGGRVIPREQQEETELIILPEESELQEVQERQELEEATDIDIIDPTQRIFLPQRRFPTGESAVIGRESIDETETPDLVEEAQEQQVTQEEDALETGQGQGQLFDPVTTPVDETETTPVSAIDQDLETVVGPEVGQVTEPDQFQEQIPGVTPFTDQTQVAAQEAIQEPELLTEAITATQQDLQLRQTPLLDSTVPQQQVEEPATEFPFEPQQAPGYDYPVISPPTTEPPRRPPGIPLPEFGGDDEDDPRGRFTGAAEGFEIPFLDPLSGN
jgi:hypothetical protein